MAGATQKNRSEELQAMLSGIRETAKNHGLQMPISFYTELSSLEKLVKESATLPSDFYTRANSLKSQLESKRKEAEAKTQPIASSPAGGKVSVTVDGVFVEFDEGWIEYKGYLKRFDDKEKLRQEVERLEGKASRSRQENEALLRMQRELSAREFLLEKELVFLAADWQDGRNQTFGAAHSNYLSLQRSELNAVLAYLRENDIETYNASTRGLISGNSVLGVLDRKIALPQDTRIDSNSDEIVEAYAPGRISLQEPRYEYSDDFKKKSGEYNAALEEYNSSCEELLAGRHKQSIADFINARNSLWEDCTSLSAEKKLNEALSSEAPVTKYLEYLPYWLKNARVKRVYSSTSINSNRLTETIHAEFYDGKRAELVYNTPREAEPAQRNPATLQLRFMDPARGQKEFQLTDAETLARWPSGQKPFSLSYYRLGAREEIPIPQGRMEITESFYHNFDSKTYTYLLERKQKDFGQSMWIYGDPRAFNSLYNESREERGYFSRETGARLKETVESLGESGIPAKVFEETTSALSQVEETGQVSGFITISISNKTTGSKAQSAVPADKGRLDFEGYQFEITNIRQKGLENVADISVYKGGEKVAALESVPLSGTEASLTIDGSRISLSLIAPEQISSQIQGASIEYNGKSYDLNLGETLNLDSGYKIKLKEVSADSGTPFARIEVYGPNNRLLDELSIAVGFPQELSSLGPNPPTITIRPIETRQPFQERLIDRTTVVKFRNLYEQNPDRYEGGAGKLKEQRDYRPSVRNLYAQWRGVDNRGEPIFAQSETIGLRVEDKDKARHDKLIAQYLTYERPSWAVVGTAINTPTLVSGSADVRWMRIDKKEPFSLYGAGGASSAFYSAGPYYDETRQSQPAYGSNPLERGKTNSGGNFILDEVRSGNLHLYANIAPWLSGYGTIIGTWGATYRNDPAKNSPLISNTTQEISFKTGDRYKQGFNVNSLLLKTYSNYNPKIDDPIITRHEAEAQFRGAIAYVLGEKYRRAVEPYARHSVTIGERSVSFQEGDMANFGEITQEYYGSASGGVSYGEKKDRGVTFGIRARDISRERYSEGQFRDLYAQVPVPIRSLGIQPVSRTRELGTNIRWQINPRNSVSTDLSASTTKTYGQRATTSEQERARIEYTYTFPGNYQPQEQEKKAYSLRASADITRTKQSGQPERAEITQIRARYGTPSTYVEAGLLNMMNWEILHPGGEFIGIYGSVPGIGEAGLRFDRLRDNRRITFNAYIPLR